MKSILSITVSATFAIAAAVNPLEPSQAAVLGRDNTFLNAPPLTNTVSDRLANQLQAAIDRSLDDIPGASVAIVSPEKAWYGSSGIANLATGTPLELGDRFQIGSITKMFVATTVLQLVEEGKLSLEDTLVDWLPLEVVANIPNYENITIRQLLNHTSGVSDYTDPLFLQAQSNPALFLRDWSPQELVSFISGQQPYFAPGESWRYSNTNYILLGLVVEAATNTNIASEIRSRILEPLELNDTFFAEEEAISGGYVSGYWDFDGDGILDDVTGANMSWAWATGAMVSNTPDLTLFIAGLLGGKLLEPESLEEMLTLIEAVDSDNYDGYGLGIGSLEGPGILWYGQRGLTLGYRSNVFYSPIEDIIYVELTNSRDLDNISAPIFAAYRSAQEPVASTPEPGNLIGLVAIAVCGLWWKKSCR